MDYSSLLPRENDMLSGIPEKHHFPTTSDITKHPQKIPSKTAKGKLKVAYVSEKTKKALRLLKGNLIAASDGYLLTDDEIIRKALELFIRQNKMHISI
ncbi:MAG: hypothetical protein IKR30_02270 [Bacteroidales bacterium]|nr:hypothetical protein [Bacteroidales bacterium]